MAAYEKAALIADKLKRIDRTVIVTPETVLEKVRDEAELSFFFSRLCMRECE